MSTGFRRGGAPDAELAPGTGFIVEDEPKDMSEPSFGSEGLAGGPAAGGPTVGDVWLTDKRGRAYVKHPSGRGMLWRQGDETIEQAVARAGAPKDRRPERKSKAPRKPAAPSKTDLKELEAMLIEALSSPAMLCAMAGDNWSADHFTNQAPALARNLVVAAEHNDWLRRRLEKMAQGGDMAMSMIALVGVGGALFAYAVPPIVWWFNLPVPNEARVMFGIPDRRIPNNAAAAFAEAA